MVTMQNLSLEAIEERIAKAKDDLAFLEKAREVLGDPRIVSILGSQPRPVTATPTAPSYVAPSVVPRSYGEVKNRVYAVLPDADASIAARVTTQQIVTALQGNGYTFKAKDPWVAVNGALVTLEGNGLAESSGKRGNAKLWRKKTQIAPASGLDANW